MGNRMSSRKGEEVGKGELRIWKNMEGRIVNQSVVFEGRGNEGK